MMSRATLQDQSFLGHQGVHSTIMRQQPQHGTGSHRPSRLMQMKDDYHRRLMKEKEEKMLNMYETNQKKNLVRAERVVKAPASHDDYPNSKLRQPGYMQPPPPQHPPPGHPPSKHSVRDFFQERRDMENKGSYMPPIKQHYQDSKARQGSSRTYSKNSAGVDRANPLAPIKPRHGGISSAPAQHPAARNNPRLVKQHTSSPDFDVNGHVRPNQRASAKKPSPPAARGNYSAKTEKLSDFQKWQMEQNKAREERLKKLNMRAPPSERESRDWGGDYEYEEEDNYEDEAVIEEEDQGQGEEILRQEQELMQRIAMQQAELDRLRREREEEEELERQQAEMLRKQQAAERERRQRQQQEEARQRREEQAQARREEEEQQRVAKARKERQRIEAQLDQYGDSIYGDSAYPPSQPNSHRDNPFQPSSHRDNPFQPSSHRDNPFQPNSHRSGYSGFQHDSSQNDAQTTPKFTPKPPSEGTPRKLSQTYTVKRPSQRKPPSPPAEEYDERPVPGPGLDIYEQATDGEKGGRVRLVSCKVCGRKFADDRIQKHQAACKNAHKKREAFDPTQMRTDGTEMAKYVRSGAHMKEPKKKKKADWRKQHKEFIANIRYAKQMQQMEQQGVSLKDLPPPPPSQTNEDLVPCPHCGRTFNELAAERHIPRCQELKTRPVPNNRRRR